MVKIATSLDGKITTGTEARWLTGEPARAFGHRLRSTHDAILTGIGTVLADDPLLTCRLSGLEERSPLRIVLDRHLRLPLAAKLVKTAREVPLWVITESAPASALALQEAGVRVFFLPQGADIRAVLSLLAEQGITRLMVEGGQAVTTAFLESGLTCTLYWFRAPYIVGAQGLAAFSVPLPRLSLAETRHLGEDNLEVYTCSPVSSPI